MTRKRKSHRGEPTVVASDVRAAELLLMEAVDEIPSGRVLCTTLGRGQFAVASALRQPASSVCCCFLDQYQWRRAAEGHASNPPANLRWECTADFPAEEFDAFALPTTAGGEAELVREFLQQAHHRLRIGGTMFVATDNPADTWLHQELRKLVPKVTRRPAATGVLYVALKTEPLRKSKNFECRFAFRDEGNLLQVVSRPGVFSHRSLDGGARALLRAAAIQPGARVLELGCGSGAVSLALARRAPDTRADAVDSNIRAVECARLGAELNGLSNVFVHAVLAEWEPGNEIAAESYDLVVANPPYFSNHRIAEIFARCATRALKPGGTVLFVTKRVDWYQERLPEMFESISLEPGTHYTIVRARRKPSDSHPWA